MGFIFIDTSAVDELFTVRSKSIQGERVGEATTADLRKSIRRPYRGIQIKEDTYATMSVIRGDGATIPLISESYVGGDIGLGRQGRVKSYSDFIIQKVQEERVEKQQIIETFGDAFVFFFGERPRILNIQGMLVNTEDFGWRQQFWENYDKHLRGTKLVEVNAQLFLSWDTIVVSGYPIQASAVEVSDNPYAVQFSMQVFLTNYEDFGRGGITDFPGSIQDVDVSVLNRELDQAQRLVSTGAQVRAANIQAAGRGTFGSLGNALREGVSV